MSYVRKIRINFQKGNEELYIQCYSHKKTNRLDDWGKQKELGKRTLHSYAYILFACSPVRKASGEEKQKNATHIPCN